MATGKDISQAKSIVLDILRIVAAVTVLLSHAFMQWGLPMFSDKDWGHTAVVVFFVLSGYVIAYTTFKNNRGWKEYTQARLAKLYSVLIPSLIITSIIQLYLYYNSPVLFASYSRNNSFIRYILSGLFINEIWFFSSAPPVNGPLWSLSFEFWYYCFFGICFYLKKSKFLYVLLVAACLIIGPKILLMMPVWLFGYFSYKIKRPKVNYIFGWVAGCLFIIQPIIVTKIVPSIPFVLGKKPFFFANQFLTDYISGILLSLGLWFLPNIQSIKKKSTKFYKQIRWAANLTFPLYLLHEPLFILYRSFFGTDNSSLISMYIAVLIVLIISIAAGHLFNKTYIYWRNLFSFILSKISFKTSLKPTQALT